MIIYFSDMRVKDENKQEAIFRATIKLVNEIGLVASSVAKIAKEAGVSPATIYIYYKNKDDLLISTYLRIKREMGRQLAAGLNKDQPLRDVFRELWFRMFDFFKDHADYFHFAEQFSNSPYMAQVNQDQVEEAFAPMTALVQKGIEQKIIKDVDLNLLAVFLFYPIYTLANSRLCPEWQLSESNIDQAFSMAWDAIKL